jgi:hypothetical protein
MNPKINHHYDRFGFLTAWLTAMKSSGMQLFLVSCVRAVINPEDESAPSM